MKDLFKKIWPLLCILLAVVYLVSSLSSYIAPVSFPYISFFALAFPYIFTVTLICCILNFFISKRFAFLMLIVLPFGTGNVLKTFSFGSSKEWEVKKDDTVFRILTWNVERFGASLANSNRDSFAALNREMLATIHSYEPDAICMQDFVDYENKNDIPSIRVQLDSMGYKFYFCSNDKVIARNFMMYAGVAIFSKTAFSDTTRISIGGTDNANMIFADMQLNNKPFRLVTAHLQSFKLLRYPDENKSDTQTVNKNNSTLNTIIETEKIHQSQVKVVRSVIDSTNLPVIYCGDINTIPASYNYRTLRGENLQDAFLEKGWGFGSTFYNYLPALRIDVCLADKKFSVSQCKVLKKKLSDHYPVITDIKWK